MHFTEADFSAASRKWWIKSKTCWAWIVQFVASLGAAIKPVESQMEKLLGEHWFMTLTTVVVVFGFYARNKTGGGLAISNPDKPS